MYYCNLCMAPMQEGEQVCPVCKRPVTDNVPAHHLRPGTILNKKFYVGKALGEGGFGITYIGMDINLEMKVAVKEYYPNGYVSRNHTISPQVEDSVTAGRKDFFEKGRDRFLKEARVLAKFSGEPGVVDVRDFFEENNTAYIVMEYLDGMDLKTYLKQRGTMTPEQTVQMLMPVMDSLKKIHKQGLIHRDISPDNIMLVGDKVKLLDFGAARSVSAEANKSLSVMLKPGYAPEEQYRSKGQQGAWTDIYALCATMYKCMTGITPDDATQRVFSDEVKTPSALGISIQPEIEHAIMRGMSVHQKDRYQSIEELVLALQGIPVEIFPTEEDKTIAERLKVPEEDVATRYEENTAVRDDVTALGENKEAAGDQATILGEEEKEENVTVLGEEKEEDIAPVQEKKEEKPEVLEKKAEKPEIPEKKTEKPEVPKKKPADSGKVLSKKWIGIGAGAAAVLLVLVIIIVAVWKPGSGDRASTAESRETLDPKEAGFIFRNEESISLIEPENALDAAEIYSTLTYTEPMFYGNYTLAPQESQDEIQVYLEEMDYGALTNDSGSYMTDIPWRIKAGPQNMNHRINEIKDHFWMEVYYYTENENLDYIQAAYEVDGKILRITPVLEFDVENTESPYVLSDTSLEYSFEFSGPNLVLSRNGKQVAMRAYGFDDRIVGNDFYDDEYYLAADGAASDGGPQIPGIKKMDLLSSDTSSYFWLQDDEENRIRDGIGRITEDGLFTFSYSDGHEKNTQYFTEQYVYFFGGRDGLVLTDGNEVYYYQEH